MTGSERIASSVITIMSSISVKPEAAVLRALVGDIEAVLAKIGGARARVGAAGVALPGDGKCYFVECAVRLDARHGPGAREVGADRSESRGYGHRRRGRIGVDRGPVHQMQ